MAKKRKRKKVKKNFKRFTTFILAIVFAIGVLTVLKYYIAYNEDLKPISDKKDYYNISDFGFIRLKSQTDYNKNGTDDYTDMLNGEKQYAKWNPKYVSKYYAGGYPEVEKEGICADLIWYAFKTAGYSLKDMISQDIDNTYKKGTYGIEIRDSNIDFRRVGNMDLFFQRYAKSLETDMYSIGNFMPGDILVFDDGDHIAMISDKYNERGVPYLIQNRDETQKQKEEDRLEETDMQITSHYRFEYNDKIESLIDQIK